MTNPLIKLKFDQELDQDMAWDFYSNPEFGGTNFWEERAIAHHPKLLDMVSSKDHEKFLNNYIDHYYKSNTKELKELSLMTSEYLNQSEDEFFKIIDDLFKQHPWPKKEFTGVFSIFDFCPRFLDWGGFQIFIYDNRNMQLFTIFHEMLHFIFYDFVQKQLPEEFNDLNTEEGKFWDLAEVFNAVIQDTDDFIKLHGKIQNIGYPNHKNLIVKGKRLWNKNQDLSLWIIEMIK